jgi:deoxyribodipyrimidine photo-lyase
MTTAPQRTLYWLTDDLRLHDNAAFTAAVENSASLICVFCWDTSWHDSDRFGIERMGKHRETFLKQTLFDLDQSLRKLGQRLLVMRGNPIESISALVAQHSIDVVVRSERPGVYERWQWRNLQQRYPFLTYKEVPTFTLLRRNQLPFGDDLPRTFTQFRTQVEALNMSSVAPTPQALPKPPPNLASTDFAPQASLGMSQTFVGGESAGLRHLHDYFSTQAASHYKHTRNALDGWYQSSKFSPWLANGSLSARHILTTLRAYEIDKGANDSTYWIFFELLWREYFQWYADLHKHRLFRFAGIRDRKPLTSFYAERFRKWSTGQTPWPIVNACMEQLNATGYMSNRGRQIVASCLVNELSLDWRCGAAYFEQQLIDYQVASNWGNWQYAAGVGADPRGGRHFNLSKQAAEHDPDGTFVARWAPNTFTPLLDSVDMVDWPILPDDFNRQGT